MWRQYIQTALLRSFPVIEMTWGESYLKKKKRQSTREVLLKTQVTLGQASVLMNDLMERAESTMQKREM